MSSRTSCLVSVARHLAACLALCSTSHVLANGCSVEVSSGLAFGVYQPLTFPGKLLSNHQDSLATLTVTCVDSSAVNYILSLGDATNRRLLHPDAGAPSMEFNLFTDPGHTDVWGDGLTGAQVSGSAQESTPQIHTVYGRIPRGQHTLKAGHYSGTVSVTVTYSP